MNHLQLRKTYISTHSIADEISSQNLIVYQESAYIHKYISNMIKYLLIYLIKE